jgi:hypothetical protein
VEEVGIEVEGSREGPCLAYSYYTWHGEEEEGSDRALLGHVDDMVELLVQLRLLGVSCDPFYLLIC